MPTITQIRLSDATRRLRVPYQRLYLAVIAGKVPAKRDETGSRWLVKESDLPMIAQFLCVPYRASDDSVPVGAAK